MKAVTLYHYTSRFHLKAILASRVLSRGDVPLSPTTGANAVWLTDDPEANRQGWRRGSVLDKAEVRITVEIPAEDPNLSRWSDFARKHGVDPAWYAVLDQVAGGGSQRWWLYTGFIPRALFSEVLLNGVPQPIPR